MKMKIKSITRNNRKATVYDIETPTHDYILDNGIISHNTMEMYSKAVVGGGTAVMYSANQIFIITKSQEKDGSDLVGWNFTINIEKSRFVREKAKLPFTVKFEGGISKWSGLLEIALDSGHVIKPSNGWYSRVDSLTGEIEDKKYRLKDTDNKNFWGPILLDKSFNEFIKNNYQISNNALTQGEIDDTISNTFTNGEIEAEISDTFDLDDED